jgi:hypothetical protein
MAVYGFRHGISHLLQTGIIPVPRQKMCRTESIAYNGYEFHHPHKMSRNDLCRVITLPKIQGINAQIPGHLVHAADCVDFAGGTRDNIGLTEALLSAPGSRYREDGILIVTCGFGRGLLQGTFYEANSFKNSDTERILI